MALNNYSNLKAAIIRWADNEDLSCVIDDCIQLCEGEFYSEGDETLRVREMEVESIAALDGADELSLPDGYLEPREFSTTYNDIKYNFEYVTPEELRPTTITGLPGYFTITDRIRFDRTPTEPLDIKMTYLGRLESLSSSSPTNTILMNYPNIYLFGSVAKAFLFSAEEDKAALWQAKFTGAIVAANKTYQRSRIDVASQIPLRGEVV